MFSSSAAARKRDRLFPGADGKGKDGRALSALPSLVEEGCDGIDPLMPSCLCGGLSCGRFKRAFARDPVRAACGTETRGGLSSFGRRRRLNGRRTHRRVPRLYGRRCSRSRQTSKANPRGFQTTEERLAECFLRWWPRSTSRTPGPSGTSSTALRCRPGSRTPSGPESTLEC